MKVHQLIEHLKTMPQDATVIGYNQDDSEWSLIEVGQVNLVPTYHTYMQGGKLYFDICIIHENDKERLDRETGRKNGMLPKENFVYLDASGRPLYVVNKKRNGIEPNTTGTFCSGEYDEFDDEE